MNKSRKTVRASARRVNAETCLWDLITDQLKKKTRPWRSIGLMIGSCLALPLSGFTSG